MSPDQDEVARHVEREPWPLTRPLRHQRRNSTGRRRHLRVSAAFSLRRRLRRRRGRGSR